MNLNHFQQRYLNFSISLVYITEVEYCFNSNLLAVTFFKHKTSDDHTEHDTGDL